MLDGYHESSFLRYSGWWSGGSGQNINDASGMVFAYSDHGLPGSWGIVTTFDYSKDSSYRHQIYGDGWNNEMYFRTRSSDRGGWNAWRHLLDDVNYRGILDGSYVKKSGDTMTGDLNFQTIGQWPAPSDETYPINSAGIIWSGSSDYAKIYYEVAAADAGRLVFNTGDDSNCIISFRNCGTQYAYIDTQGLHGAVWNDYAECRKSNENEPGRVVLEDNFGVCQITIQRLQPFAGVISDTYGFCQGETNDAKTPLAVAGRVLVYTYQNKYNYKIGDCVCAAPNGTVDIMTREEVREYPDRIVGTVSEIPDYEVWGTGNVKVNGRIWIKVK